MTTIQSTDAYVLSEKIVSTPYGQKLTFTTLVPVANRPEPRQLFQALLSRDELRTLRDVIDRALVP